MNNPHAFPIVGQWGVTEQGMTLRDYFAGKAMQSLIVTRNGVIGTNRYEYLVTEDSYKIADAMLKAREA
tara:strand:- start:1600 stop:1806 length:207 start_codon:yes stop_codon:yes gene_type:complete